MRSLHKFYVLDSYNKFARNADVVKTFSVNGRLYCIREVNEFEQGIPVWPEQSIDDYYENTFVYASIEDAEAFIKQIAR